MNNPIAKGACLWLLQCNCCILSNGILGYFLVILISLIVSIEIEAQDITIGICEDESYELNFPGNQVLAWRDLSTGDIIQTIDAGGNAINDHTPTVSPDVTTTYEVSYYNFYTDNIITYGDFERPGGYTDAQKDVLTQYSIARLCPAVNGIGPGNWGLGTTTDCIERTLAENWYADIPDHTYGDGTGNMLFFDASTAPIDIYRTNVNVTNGVEYAFSAWVANIHSGFLNPYEMEFYINGSATGSTLIGTGDNSWRRFFTIWTANSSGNIPISIRNVNTEGTGNDLAIDDIAMAEVRTRNFIVTVNQAPEAFVNNVTGESGSVIHITSSVTEGDGSVNDHDWTFAPGILDISDPLNPFVNIAVAPGSYPISYRVTDDNSCSSDVAYATVTVIEANNAPVAANDYIELTVNSISVGNVLLNDMDPEGDAISVTITPLIYPNYGELELNTDGTYTYTPDLNYIGADAVQYQVCDIHGDCSNAWLYISVVNQAPEVEGEEYNTTVNTGIPGNLLLNDSDPNGDEISVTIIPVINPNHGELELNPDGTFIYTPDLNYIGADSVQYEVCDIHGDCSNAWLLISIINQPPEVEGEEYITSVNSEVYGNLLLNDTDPNGDEISVTTTPVINPNHGELELNTDGAFTYSLELNYIGADSLLYEVCDIHGDCSNAWLFVSAVNQPPEVEGEEYMTTVNAGISGNLVLNDTDPNGDEISVTTAPVINPNHGELELNTDGTCTYTPNLNYIGADSLQYEVCDIHGACSNAWVLISIDNQPPEVEGEEYFTTVNVGISDDLLLNDTDPNGDEITVTTILVINPNHGELNFNADGTCTYTPDLNFAGADSLQYEVCDIHGACSNAWLIISVVNQPPEVEGEEYFTVADSAISSNLLLNDFDPDGDVLRPETTPVFGPVNGAIILYGDGSFVYTPSTGWCGIDTIEYRVCDILDVCDQAIVIIHVANKPPIAVDDLFEMGTNETLSGSLIANDYDPNGDSIFILIMPELYPQRGSLTLFPDGTFEYISEQNMNATEYFKYKLCDSHNDCSIGLVTIASTIEIEVPNVFTPNGDNINDLFMSNYNLSVYDRNGAILYEGTEGWDGTFNGVPVDEDTYFYRVLYSEWEELDSQVKGYVVLVR